MAHKISIIGHFGFGKTLLNGQTIKTKIVTEELENEYSNNEINKYDTHGGKISVLKLPFQILSALMKSENIIIFPAYNGLRVIAPLLCLANRVFNRSLHYVVIGGWLPTFLDNKRYLAKKLKRFDGIYVETLSMKDELDKRGFHNVYVMPNCKQLEIIDENSIQNDFLKPFKLCTFSRVMKAKGIEDAVMVVQEVNRELKQVAFSLDIYGQIDSDEVEWFSSLEESFPDYIRYEGLVPFGESTKVLKDYYALLFPTYHDGEGFAGTLIDAMAAGLPVIASNWKYNPELVMEGRTGLLYESKNNEKFKECLLYAYNNQSIWNEMKKNCCREAYQFLPQHAVKVLKEHLR